MAERIQKTKTPAKKEQEAQEDIKTDSKEDLKAEIDDLLDEIDGLLEENAEEFVKGFVQKGGQLCETLWYNIKSRNQRVILRLKGSHENLLDFRLQ